ncbi:MAG TPA: response regulator [Candidatus Hydrogenedens sp.]|nr:response regulator [Candidatus Hydrogenedens sp.]
MDKCKVLVVDDEPDVVELLERTLKSEGFNVISAYDGIAALDLVSTEKPDLVLLDLMMPMMSGYEVCEQIKSNPQTQSIPIICVTSAHTPDARARSLQLGASDVITKPFYPSELIARIKRYIQPRE